MKINVQTNTGLWLCFTLILFAVLSRLLPHPYNFTPIGALGLFAGACFGMRRFWLVPLLALLISDVLIGFYHPLVMVSVYLSFLITACIGRAVLLNQRSVMRIAGTTLSASVIFFILSNLGDWLSGINGYPMTFSGLLECYAMAIPFFGNTVAGDLFYATALFGIYEGVRQWFVRKQSAYPA